MIRTMTLKGTSTQWPLPNHESKSVVRSIILLVLPSHINRNAALVELTRKQSERFREALLDLPPTCDRITLICSGPSSADGNVMNGNTSSNQRRNNRHKNGSFSIRARGDFGETEVSPPGWALSSDFVLPAFVEMVRLVGMSLGNHRHLCSEVLSDIGNPNDRLSTARLSE